MITCAIQIGSSHLLAVAADKDMHTGRLSNVQVESEPAADCVEHGCITNVSNAAAHLRTLMQKLGDRMGVNLGAAYLGIGGISLHSLVQQPTVQLPDYDVLQSEPIAGDLFQLIVGRKFLRDGALAAMQQAGLEVHDIFPIPMATARILTEEDRQRGCMLLDMGAGTTTIAIYKGGDLRHLAVIPIGGEAVTLDIQSAGCSHDEAEHIKLQWSDVTSDIKSSVSPTTNHFADKALPFPLSKLNTIALCRYEEIAANIVHQLDRSGLKDQLEVGCIVTGGVAMQRGIVELLSRCLPVSDVSIRAYNERAMLGSNLKPNLSSALALLGLCQKDCVTVPTPAVVEEKPEPTPATTTAGTTTDTRTGNNDDDGEDNLPDDGLRHTIGSFIRDLFTGQ